MLWRTRITRVLVPTSEGSIPVCMKLFSGWFYFLKATLICANIIWFKPEESINSMYTENYASDFCWINQNQWENGKYNLIPVDLTRIIKDFIACGCWKWSHSLKFTQVSRRAWFAILCDKTSSQLAMERRRVLFFYFRL